MFALRPFVCLSVSPVNKFSALFSVLADIYFIFGTLLFSNKLQVKFEFVGPLIFSSPELKAQVSFSDHPYSGVRPSVNFSHFQLLLNNHWANFNQSWHKASLGKGNSKLLK